MDLPLDLINFLKSNKELEYDYSSIEPNFVGIIDFEKLKLSEIWIEGETNDKSYYKIPAINLTDKCEYYSPEFILLYLPNEKLFGTWDSDHWKLYIFPKATWTDIVSNPAPYLNQQWNPTEEFGLLFNPKENYILIKGWPF